MNGADPVARLLALLDNVKPNGTGYTARCPGHDDRHNSLKVDRGSEGQALVHCHAGCDPERILDALGWRLADLYPPRAESASQRGHGRRIVATYDYRDEDGTLLYQGVRYEPKDFRQRRPDGNGGWLWNLQDVRHVPFRLPELRAADPDEWVLIPEGEKDAERLTALGFVATTNAAGAGKWRPELSDHLHGRRVCILPDHDPAGEKHAAAVARSLAGIAAEVRIVRLPNLPNKGDVSDWCDAGGTAEELRRLIESAPSPEPGQEGTGDRGNERSPRLVVRSLSEIVSIPPDWYWHRWLPKGKFCLIGGYAGDGKSTLLAALAAAASKGETWPDGTGSGRKLRTLFVLGEDAAADTLKPRLELHGADMDQIFVIETVLDESGRERYFNVTKHLDLLEAAIVEHRIDWLVIDPLTTIMPGTDRNAEGDTRDTLTPLVKLADRLGVTVTGVAHVGKSEGSRRAAQKILGATAFHAMARIVWMIAPDPDGRMVLGVAKSNLAVKPPSLAWTRDEDQPIQWEGVSAQDVEDLLANAPASSPRADAEGFLREFLSGGSQPSVAVQDAAKARGISEKTLRRAADAIPVKKWKAAGTNGQWYWSLPDGQPTTATPPESAPEGNLATSRDTDVAKLAKFQTDNLVNGAGRGHLLTTTPIFGNGHANDREHVMEGGQLGQPETLRGGQVPVDHDSVVAQAKRLASLTPDELTAYRLELDHVPASDPHIAMDRQALALLDAMYAVGAIA